MIRRNGGQDHWFVTTKQVPCPNQVNFNGDPFSAMHVFAVSQQNLSGLQVTSIWVCSRIKNHSPHMSYGQILVHAIQIYSNHAFVCVEYRKHRRIFHEIWVCKWTSLVLRVDILMFPEVPWCAWRSTAWIDFRLATKPTIPEPLLNHPCGLSSPFFDRLAEQKWVRILALRSVTSSI